MEFSKVKSPLAPMRYAEIVELSVLETQAISPVTTTQQAAVCLSSTAGLIGSRLSRPQLLNESKKKGWLPRALEGVLGIALGFLTVRTERNSYATACTVVVRTGVSRGPENATFDQKRAHKAGIARQIKIPTAAPPQSISMSVGDPVREGMNDW